MIRIPLLSLLAVSLGACAVGPDYQRPTMASDLPTQFARQAPGVQADASVARYPDLVCAVLTADCLPVLLCARDGGAVAAVHAGWRGLAAGVIETAAGEIGSCLWLLVFGARAGTGRNFDN